MNGLIQMLMNNKLKQIPQNLMSQLEGQLKRVNPQAYQEFQQARKNNSDPREYLNRVVGEFSPQQRREWDNMMGQFSQPQTQKQKQEEKK